MICLVEPSDAEGVAAARQLLEAYTATRKGDPVGPELQEDIEDPTMSKKGGLVLLLAREGPRGEPLGIIAVRKEHRVADSHTAELKRLFVLPAARGRNLGLMLSTRALAEALALGFRRVVLDTLPSMRTAQAMYDALGFRDMAVPYKCNPNPGTRYLELLYARCWEPLAARPGPFHPSLSLAPPELMSELRAGRVLLVVGSDLSTMAGLPSARQLLQLVAQDLGAAADVDSDELARHYSALVATAGKARVCEVLRRRLALQPGAAPQRAFLRVVEALRRLPIAGVLSWALDGLLDVHLAASGSASSSVSTSWEAVDLGSLVMGRETPPRLVLMRGDAADPVLTEEELQAPATAAPRRRFMEAAAGAHTLLFLGPHALTEWSEGGGDVGAAKPLRRHYALVPDRGLEERQALAEKGITLLSYLPKATGNEGPALLLMSMVRQLEQEAEQLESKRAEGEVSAKARRTA